MFEAHYGHLIKISFLPQCIDYLLVIIKLLLECQSPFLEYFLFQESGDGHLVAGALTVIASGRLYEGVYKQFQTIRHQFFKLLPHYFLLFCDLAIEILRRRVDSCQVHMIRILARGR